MKVWFQVQGRTRDLGFRDWLTGLREEATKQKKCQNRCSLLLCLRVCLKGVRNVRCRFLALWFGDAKAQDSWGLHVRDRIWCRCLVLFLLWTFPVPTQALLSWSCLWCRVFFLPQVIPDWLSALSIVCNYNETAFVIAVSESRQSRTPATKQRNSSSEQAASRQAADDADSFTTCLASAAGTTSSPSSPSFSDGVSDLAY